MNPKTIYVEKASNGRYFLAYQESDKVRYVFKNDSYDRSWNTLFGAKIHAKRLAQKIDVDTIIVKNC